MSAFNGAAQTCVCARIQLGWPGGTAVTWNPNEQVEGRGRCLFSLSFFLLFKRNGDCFSTRLLFSHPTWGCLNFTKHHLGSRQAGRRTPTSAKAEPAPHSQMLKESNEAGSIRAVLETSTGGRACSSQDLLRLIANSEENGLL